MASRSHNRKTPPLPEDFRQAVEAALTSLGWKILTWDEDDGIEYLPSDGEKQTAHLENLYRRACKAEQAEWPAMITGFFTSINTSMGQGLSEKPLGEFAEQLLVRIGRPVNAGGKIRPWSRALGDSGLSINLVIDFPTSMAYVNEDQIEESGRPADEWLARALDNLHARTSPDSLELVDEESGLRACQMGDSYDAPRALILDRLLPNHPNGFLVAVPNRELLVVLPTSVEVVEHLHRLKFVAVNYSSCAVYAMCDS